MSDKIAKIFKSKLIFGKYSLKQLITNGTFGEVYIGTNIFNKKNYAIKIEKLQNNESSLKQEAYILFLLKGPGIPSLISFGISCKYHILVEELLGESIKTIFNKNKKFNIKDTCMFAIQALERIEYIHSKNYLHRDIKPGNFLVGNPDKSQLYLIDFGIAKKFRSSKTGKLQRYKKRNKLYGTVTFLSLNALNGEEITRKDELESLGLLFIYLYKGFLPWSKLKFKNPIEATKSVKLMRQKTSLEELCSSMPREMFEYMDYINKLNFENEPNYTFLKSLFFVILRKIGEDNDLMFSWVDKNITPNRIKSISKSKSKSRQKLYNNILLSNMKKENIAQTSNENTLIKEKIINRSQNKNDYMIKKDMNLKAKQINYKENDKKINLNEKTFHSQKGKSNIINKIGNIKKQLKNNNNFMKINAIKKPERENKLIKSEEKSYITKLNINKNKSLLNRNKTRNIMQQNLFNNLNININNTINYQDLKTKKYIFNIINSKNTNDISKNKNKMKINSINTDKFQNNNYYTYKTFIKNHDGQKIDKKKLPILMDLSHKNIKTQNAFHLNFSPYKYKSIFKNELMNKYLIKDTERLIKQKEIGTIKKHLITKTEKINTNFDQ